MEFTDVVQAYVTLGKSIERFPYFSHLFARLELEHHLQVGLPATIPSTNESTMAVPKATQALHTLRSEAALADLLAHPVQFAPSASLAAGAESAAALAGLQGATNVIVVNPAEEATEKPLTPAEQKKRNEADRFAQAETERQARLKQQDTEWIPPWLPAGLEVPRGQTQDGAQALVPAPSAATTELEPDESLGLMATLELLLFTPPVGAALLDGARRTTFLPPSVRSAPLPSRTELLKPSDAGPRGVLTALVALASSATSSRLPSLPQALVDVPTWSDPESEEQRLPPLPYAPGNIATALLSALQRGPGRGLASLTSCEWEEVVEYRDQSSPSQRTVTENVLHLPKLLPGLPPTAEELESSMDPGTGSTKERRKRKRAAEHLQAQLMANPPPRAASSVEESLSAFWSGQGEGLGDRSSPGSVQPVDRPTLTREVTTTGAQLVLWIDNGAPLELSPRVRVPTGQTYKLVGAVTRGAASPVGWVVYSQASLSSPWRTLDVGRSPTDPRVWRTDRAPTSAPQDGVLAIYAVQPEDERGGKRKKAAPHDRLFSGLDSLLGTGQKKRRRQDPVDEQPDESPPAVPTTKQVEPTLAPPRPLPPKKPVRRPEPAPAPVPTSFDDEDEDLGEAV